MTNKALGKGINEIFSANRVISDASDVSEVINGAADQVAFRHRHAQEARQALLDRGISTDDPALSELVSEVLTMALQVSTS